MKLNENKFARIFIQRLCYMKKQREDGRGRNLKRRADVQKMLKNFKASVKNATTGTGDFEKRLAEFLLRRCAGSGISVDDLKDIIWNGNDHTLISRAVSEIARQNPKAKFEDILAILNEAWNNFPHKCLNGLSPSDIIRRLAQDKEFSSETRPDFYTLFSNSFPEKPSITRIKGNEWSWEFPAVFHSTRTIIAEMRQNDESFEEYDGCSENAGSDELKIEQTERELIRRLDLVSAKIILESDPLQFDAAVMLARDVYQNGDDRQAVDVLETAIEHARGFIPAEFMPGKDIFPWYFTDNRPMLLLLGEYATLVDIVKGTAEAIPHYEELIDLNPNDNQGIRGFLATAYLKTNRFEELLSLDNKFQNDLLVELSVGTLLALYKLGRFDEARKRILKTKKYLLHVFGEILKIEHPQPELTSGRILAGGADEAWLYWQNQGTLWMASPGAREFLKKHLDA